MPTTPLIDFLLWACLFVPVIWWLSAHALPWLADHYCDLHQNRQRIFGIVFVLGFLLIVVPLTIGRSLSITGSNWIFWLQTIAGNWSPSDFPAFHDTGNTASSSTIKSLSGWPRDLFSLSAVVGITLNNALIVWILATAWRAIKAERRRIMELAREIKFRDNMVRATIQNSFRTAAGLTPQQKLLAMNLVKAAFEKGINDWAGRYLRTRYNDPEAKEILAALQPDEEPEPTPASGMR